MKCPKCGSTHIAIGGKPGDNACYDCRHHWGDLHRCQHEPANFSGEPANVVYRRRIPGPPPLDPRTRIVGDGEFIEMRLPHHVCRLCGVFYTDLDAVAAGEKKYQEAQDAQG